MTARRASRGRTAAAVALLAAGPFASTLLAADVVGRLDGIQVGSVPREEVERAQLGVRRGSDAQPGRNGMPLLAGDVLTTGADVRALVRLDEGEDRILTLDPETETELVDHRSILLRIGRLFASLRGRFELTTPFGRLGAIGTEFSVEVTKDGLDVLGLSGSLELQPDGPRTASLAPRLLLAQAAAPAVPAPLRLERLTRTVYRPGEGAARLLAAEEDLVRRVVGRDSEVVIATRPPAPSRSLMRQYASEEERAEAFQAARFAAIWTPDREGVFERLGDALADWAEADRARRAYDRAGKRERTRGEQALFLNKLGNVQRLAGDLDAAEEAHRKALAADPHFAFPYNGLGDVQQDRAAAAFEEGRLEDAAEQLAKAEAYYERSLDPSLWGKEGGSNRAVPCQNLGDVLLLRSQLASRPGGRGLREAEAAVRGAAEWFRRALDTAPGSPFARVGLARVHFATAALEDDQGRPRQGDERLAAARAELADVLAASPRFAVAHQWLGQVLERQGDEKTALRAYRRATELDPLYARAYFGLAQALDRRGDRDQARLYYQAFLRVESPPLLGGRRGDAARKALETEPARAPVPALRGLTPDDARRALDRSRLRLGRVYEEESRERQGTVVRQSPPPGTPVAPGTPVDVWVAVSAPARVPGLGGLTAEQARRALEQSRLRLGRVFKEESRAREGTVVRQSPPPGTAVSPGTPVDVWVAVAAPTRVPGLGGLSPEQARRALEQSRLRLGRVFKEESQAREGTIVRQSPPPGTAVSPGTPVDVWVAVAARVRVPNLHGLTRDQAARRLAEAGLRLGTVSAVVDPAPPGTVVRQEPKAGTPVPPRSSVAVWLATPKRVH